MDRSHAEVSIPTSARFSRSALEQALCAEPEWEPCDPLAVIPRQRSFVEDDPAGERLMLRFFLRPEAPRMVAKVWFGRGAEGPPGHAHGGSIMAVLDEAMGAAVWDEGHAVVLARFSADLKAVVPLEQILLLEAWVEGVDGRKVEARGRLLGSGGLVHAQSHGLFVTVGVDRFDELSDAPPKARP